MLLCGMNKLPQLYRSELEELKNLLQVTQQSATAPSCISHYPSLRMVKKHSYTLNMKAVSVTSHPVPSPNPALMSLLLRKVAELIHSSC